MNIFEKPNIRCVKELLSSNQLLTEDLLASKMEHFFGCGEDDNLKGVIGLEIYAEDGLLRSLAVSSSARSLGCGSALVEKLEAHAHSMGVKHLYLLTNTAEDYFERRGFVAINRDLASEAIKQTREFSELCPSSTVVMRKSITS